MTAVTVVLYESQDPINIGAVVRAMKNMGAVDLRLIRPCPYDLNPCDWIKCYFDEHKTLEQIEATKHHVQKTTSFWCSALITFVLVVAGVLEKSVPWTMITPYDFSAFRAPQRLVYRGCAYDAEIRLC